MRRGDERGSGVLCRRMEVSRKVLFLEVPLGLTGMGGGFRLWVFCSSFPGRQAG